MRKKQDRYSYPSFLGFDEPTSRYYVLFPDLPGCTTTGDSEAEILSNAKEALSLHIFGMEEDGDEIPVPSPVLGLRGENGEALVLTEVFMPSFRERMQTKAVSRTVTLPFWLDREAKTAELNYSRILQDSIMSYLNISRTVVKHKTQRVLA